MQTPVFVKETSTDIGVSLNLSQELQAGESITSIVVASISPTGSLLVTITGFALQAATLQIQNGLDNTTYGVEFTVVTSLGRTFRPVAAVFVDNENFASFVTQNPYTFQSLVDSIAAGEAALGKAFFVLPPDYDATNGYVTWSLIDNANRVFSSGNTYDYRITVSSFSNVVEANAVVHVPSDIPASLDSQRYQLRWELQATNQQSLYLFENIKVLSLSSVPTGVTDTVELQGDQATLSFVNERLYDTVGIEVFNDNTTVQSFALVANPKRVASGWLYSTFYPTAGLPARLDAFQVSWKYWNSQNPSNVTRQTAKLFAVTPTILVAVEDVRAMVEKARNTLFQFKDTLFETTTILGFLVRGRDMFNAAGGQLTTFEMTYATGGVREFWMRYSEIAMLRAQALAEGEKAFDFQGQAISLSVNKAEHYNQLADALQSTVDQEVGPYKKALKSAGITGGPGNVANAQPNNVPKLGISIHPASPFGGYGGYFPRF